MTTTTESRGRTSRAAAIAWHRGLHELLCDRIEPWAHGRVVGASEFRESWDVNAVYAAGPLDVMDAAALLRVADEHHGDLPHRLIQVEDEHAAARLRPQFEALRFRTTPLVHMVHAGDVPAAQGAIRVRQAPDADAQPLRRRWYAEEPWAQSATALDGFLDSVRRAHERQGGHALLVDGPPGTAPVAFVRVRIAGDVGEIAEAFAVPAVRGRGIGGALVTAAIRQITAAGARHVLIVADAEGRAVRLYRRLGFRPVWTLHQFLRTPGTT